MQSVQIPISSNIPPFSRIEDGNTVYTFTNDISVIISPNNNDIKFYKLQEFSSNNGILDISIENNKFCNFIIYSESDTEIMRLCIPTNIVFQIVFKGETFYM